MLLRVKIKDKVMQIWGERMNKKALEILRIVAICLCIAIIVYEAVKLYQDNKEYETAGNEYEQIRTQALNWPQSEDESEELQYPLLQIDFDGLSEVNPDFIGWLYFPALDISYPVVHENEIDQYLHLTFEGKNNKAGCIFQDVLSDPEFRGMHDIVFGHNMRDGSMFGNLKKLYQGGDNVIADNPYIYVYTKDYVFQYRIFGYYNTNYDSDAYSVVKTDEEYEDFLYYIDAHSVYKRPADANLSEKPSLLTLSTCSGSSGSGRRFVVHTYKCMAWARQ